MHRAKQTKHKDIREKQNRSIPVVILCGGKGTRLKEETESVPKPLVRIGNYPMLWHIMKIYSFYGFNHFILLVGYKGEKIKEYFINRNILNADFTADFTNQSGKITRHSSTKEPWKVTVIDTGLDTQTGARIKRIESYIKGSTFFLTYGDGVSNINIKSLLDFHKKHSYLATVTGVHPPARFGEIVLNGITATNFNEKPYIQSTYINGGFFVLNKEIFSYLDDDEKLNFEKDVLPKVAKNGELAVFCHEGYWQCMDTRRDMEILDSEWEAGKAQWKIWET